MIGVVIPGDLSHQHIIRKQKQSKSRTIMSEASTTTVLPTITTTNSHSEERVSQLLQRISEMTYSSVPSGSARVQLRTLISLAESLLEVGAEHFSNRSEVEFHLDPALLRVVLEGNKPWKEPLDVPLYNSIVGAMKSARWAMKHALVTREAKASEEDAEIVAVREIICKLVAPTTSSTDDDDDETRNLSRKEKDLTAAILLKYIEMKTA